MAMPWEYQAKGLWLAFVYYDNVDATVNGSGLLVTSAAIGESNDLLPITVLGRKGALEQTPNGPLRGSISLSYLIETFNDPGYDRISYLKTGHNNFDYPNDKIVVGGLSGEGYLTSYSFAANSNSPISAETTYIVFNGISGKQQEQKNPTIKYNTSSGSGIPYGSTCFIFTSGNYDTIKTYDFKYSFRADYAPVFAIGSIKPIQVQMLGGEETFVLTRDYYTGIQYSGQNATGFFLATGNTDIDLIGIGYFNNDTRYIMRFEISGAKALSNSIRFSNQDFVRVETVAKSYF